MKQGLTIKGGATDIVFHPFDQDEEMEISLGHDNRIFGAVFLNQSDILKIIHYLSEQLIDVNK
jgi:hypothetical protein